MGFRLRNLNPLYRTCITRLSSSNFPPPVLESLNCHPLQPFLTENPAFKIPKRWHLGHSHHDEHDRRHKEGENIFRLGLAADICLATGKAFTGYLSGSTAIIADAAHSISDVVLSGIALVSFKVAKAPRDKEHPYGRLICTYTLLHLSLMHRANDRHSSVLYCKFSVSLMVIFLWFLISGHGKFETIGALGISCMLLATGGGIAWHAVDLLMGLFSPGPEMVSQALAHGHGHSHEHGGHHHGIDMDHPILALNMTIVSICVKEGLYWVTKQAGEKQGSGLMKANAWHHRADAISSVVALIGVGGSILGMKFLDPLAGLLVSGMILKAGAESGYQSVLELVDAAIPAQQLDPIKQTILQVDGVKGCHRLRGRRAGSYLYLDVHIEVDPFSSVTAAHDIGEKVRHQIHKSHPTVVEIFIHIDPAMSYASPCTIDQQDSWSADMDQQSIVPAEDDNIKEIVSDIISSKFPQMLVERITRHTFQSKLVLQIEVSMPHDILIRHAMEMAQQAEKEILKAVSNTIHVCIQLRLGQPFPQISHT
ncbi:Metal tolerance protein [Vigna angularis]|uniref:Metal tolerance protein n=1 Tax=Phaseolus angularis TaxID=3914 RepID=A0A8T0KUU6_PHAAN|nr:Metal tolerance protein [Vigna angularis]